MQNPLTHSGFMLVHSLCVAVAPYAFYTVALDHMDAGKASILCSCEPVAAMVFGICFWRNPNCAFYYRVNYRISSACNVGASGEKTHKKGTEFQSLFFRFTGQYGRIELISERIKNIFLKGFMRCYEGTDAKYDFGKCRKINLLFALPLMLGNICQQLYTMVDTMIVGQVAGVEALAALGSVDF